MMQVVRDFWRIPVPASVVVVKVLLRVGVWGSAGR
jgi:hypothetical protein